MGKIDLKYIDLSKLPLISSGYHLESKLYHDNEIAYKVFKKTLTEPELVKKERKIELLQDGVSLPNVVMSIDKLTHNESFCGYTMEYIKQAKPLFDFNQRSSDINLFLKIISIISKSVEEVHQDSRNILIGDLNFDNIIIDKKFNPFFVDFDSCQIDGITNETISKMLWTYISNRNQSQVDTTKESDKFNLFLCTLYTIFKRDVDHISMYQYDKRAERITTLKNMREFVLEAKKYQGTQTPEVPYLHELIDEKDTKPKSKTIQVKNKKRI